MEANKTMTASVELVNDPDAFIKLCDSPSKRRERELLVERDIATETLTHFVCNVLLSAGFALIVVAMFK